MTNISAQAYADIFECYVAKDDNGNLWAYECEPKRTLTGWAPVEGEIRIAYGVDTNTIDKEAYCTGRTL